MVLCEGTSPPAAKPRVIRGCPANLSGFAPKHGPLMLAKVAALPGGLCANVSGGELREARNRCTENCKTSHATSRFAHLLQISCGHHNNHHFNRSYCLTQSRMDKIEPAPERNTKRTRAEMESCNNDRNGSEVVHDDDSKTGYHQCLKHKLTCLQTIHLPMTTLDQPYPLPLPKRSAESFRTRSSTSQHYPPLLAIQSRSCTANSWLSP